MQQAIPQKDQYRNQREGKQQTINIHLICETSLDTGNTKSLTEEERIEVVIALKSIHLEWLNIRKIENLQVFSNLNVLYLQHNKIAKIENLQTLINLEYLALNDNYITRAENLGCLKSLLGLNLNNNQIQEIDYANLPLRMQLISFKNNPVIVQDSNYKLNILKNLKDLDMLDGHNISPEDKFKALGIFPKHLLDYASKMKHFRNKREIQIQLEEAEKKDRPLLLGGGMIDEKEALGEMRTKTRLYLHESQQTFKQQVREQVQNFEEKISVSKKIRGIREQQQKKRMSRLQLISQQHFEDGEQTEQTKNDKA